jgi:hypothetical protein
VHASTETARHYRYVKDWPDDAWRALFDATAARRDARFVLLGHSRAPRSTRRTSSTCGAGRASSRCSRWCARAARRSSRPTAAC